MGRAIRHAARAKWLRDYSMTTVLWSEVRPHLRLQFKAVTQ